VLVHTALREVRQVTSALETGTRESTAERLQPEADLGPGATLDSWTQVLLQPVNTLPTPSALARAARSRKSSPMSRGRISRRRRKVMSVAPSPRAFCLPALIIGLVASLARAQDTQASEDSSKQGEESNPFSTQVPLMEKEWERVSALQFHGYLRAGAGKNSSGGNQVCFQAPGAPVKFRLGNECEAYSELLFAWDAYRPEPAGPYFRVNTRLAFDGGWPVRLRGVQLFAPEVYVDAGNLFDGGPRFWAGKRLYRQDRIPIDDFYFWDVSGPGAGVDKIDIGLGKISLAYFRVANPKADQFAVLAFDPDGTPKQMNGMQMLKAISGMNLIQTHQVVSKEHLHWSEIPLNPNGTLELAIEARQITGGRKDVVGSYGLIGNAMHTQKTRGGFNQLVFQYGQGLGANIDVAPDVKAENTARTYRIIDWLLIQPSPILSAGFLAIYQRATGVQSQPRHWLSVGTRPIFNLSERFRIAVEGGADFVYPRVGGMRRLIKATLAPELAVGRKFFDGPVLRAFGTCAFWNGAAAAATDDGHKGLVFSDSGQPPFADDRHGFNFGVQAESWW
jgi:maltoporin